MVAYKIRSLPLQRTLIFDYLCQNAFTSTARTFVKDTAIRHLDSDGDEIMASSSAPAHDLLAETMEESLGQAELRRGAFHCRIDV